MRIGRHVLMGAITLISFLGAQAAMCQTEDLGGVDTLFLHPKQTPVTYITTYDRDVSSGTWIQSLNYTMAKTRYLLSLDGNSNATEFFTGSGLGSGSGAFDGSVFFVPTRNWVVGVNGTFNKISSTDPISQSTQRQNRLKVTSQYTVKPVREVDLRAALFSEFQQDHTLTLRPLGQEKTKYFTVYNALGDSIGVDSLFVRDQRDSTYMSGRNDGMTLQADWKLNPRLRIISNANGSRVQPVTNSYLRDIGRDVGGAQAEHRDFTRYESPNSNLNFDSKATYTGFRGLQTWLWLKRLKSSQQYFDKLSRTQEGLDLDRRSAQLHVEQSPWAGVQVTLDGLVDRNLSQYTVRTSRTSLVSGRSFKGTVGYNPSVLTRAGLEFDLERHQNSRQSASANGANVSHFLQATGAHRLTSRLSVDLVSSMSLTSFQYDDHVLDRDNLRSYINVGGGYQVSARCSTTVHFSTSRGHSVALDPSQSGDNNVQNTYQMDATLRLRLTPCTGIEQNYSLNAFYQIYDASAAESKNILSRIRRIDTTLNDSLFPFAQLQLRHNFLFFDTGSYRRLTPEESRRYSVTSQTYQQTLAASLILKPITGIDLFVIQSLGNISTNVPAIAATTISTRWNLAVGANVLRGMRDGSELRGTVQHVGGYTEQRLPTDPLNEQNDWIVSAQYTKPF